MIAHLDPRQAAFARRWTAADPQRVDESADERHAVRIDGDRLVLPGLAAPIRIEGLLEATVADDGTVAVKAHQGKKDVLGIVGADGALQVLDGDVHAGAIDFSPDGMNIASAQCYDVSLTDRQGRTQPLVHMPVFIESLEYLPGGQLLAGGRSNGWGGESAPAWFTIDPQSGRFDFISNLDEAEGIGHAVRPPLLEQHERAWPNTTPEQRTQLLERYGYQMPHYRALSSDQRHMVFDLQPLYQDPSQGERGVYVFEAGSGLPRRVYDPTTSTAFGGRSLNGARFSASGTRAAIVFSGGGQRDMLGISQDEGKRFHALPLDVDGKHVHWSPSEHLLAFDVLDGERHLVYGYDADEQRWFPILPDASVDGWDGKRVRVTTADGRKLTIAPAPLDPSQAESLVLGSPQGRKAPGEVKIDGDDVVINGIRVHRNPGPVQN